MDSDKIPSKRKRTFSTVDLNVLEYISNRNLFLLCCIAACFSLVSIKMCRIIIFSCYLIEFVVSIVGDRCAHIIYICGRDMRLYSKYTIVRATRRSHLKYMRLCMSLLLDCEFIITKSIFSTFLTFNDIHEITIFIVLYLYSTRCYLICYRSSTWI